MSISIHDLVLDLKAKGIRFYPSGDTLLIDAPKGLISSMDLEILKNHKEQILNLIQNATALHELEQLGVAEKWRNYLLERVEILTKFEGYSLEGARAEVVKMIPYYRELN